MKLRQLWHQFIDGKTEGKETEFLPAILEVTETPPSPTGRVVLWSILALITAAIIWACVGHINEVAVATGKVIPAGQVKTVQVKNKGIVKEIHVKDGDHVKEGDTLIVLDPTSTDADYDSLKKRAAYYKLDIDRLNAELTGAPFSPQPDDDLEDTDRQAEIALYQSRQGQYRAETAAAESTIAQKTAELHAAQQNYDKYYGMYEIALEKEKRLRELMEENAVAEFQLFEQTSQRIQYEKSAQAALDEISKAQAAINEAQTKLESVDATYKKDIMSTLVESKKQYYAYEEEIKKADENQRLATVTAPCDGTVYNLGIHTEGAVVTDAQALMMIVPDDVPMEFEVWADNKDIGFIKEGQEAEVKVDTYNFQKFGMVKADVAEIAADAYEDSRDPEKNKKFRLVLQPTEDDIRIFGKKADLTPGMSVNAEIKIREKRIIDFFLDPFRRYTSESLRER